MSVDAPSTGQGLVELIGDHGGTGGGARTPMSPRDHHQQHELGRLQQQLTVRFRCVEGHAGVVTTRGGGAGVHDPALLAHGHIAKPFTHTPDWRSRLRRGMEFEVLVNQNPGEASWFLRDDGDRVLHFVKERHDTTDSSMGNRWILSKTRVRTCVRVCVCVQVSAGGRAGGRRPFASASVPVSPHEYCLTYVGRRAGHRQRVALAVLTLSFGVTPPAAWPGLT